MEKAGYSIGFPLDFDGAANAEKARALPATAVNHGKPHGSRPRQRCLKISIFRQSRFVGKFKRRASPKKHIYAAVVVDAELCGFLIRRRQVEDGATAIISDP